MENETTDFIRQRIESDLAANALDQGVITRFPLGCDAASFLIGEVVSAQRDPITSTTRIWAEWDVIPNT